MEQEDFEEAEVAASERDYCLMQDHWDAIRKGEEPDPRDTWGDWIGDDE